MSRLGPHLVGFVDELTKIAQSKQASAMIGALIGGGIGTLTGGKHRAALGVAGAAAGGLIGGGLGAAQRFIHGQSAQRRALAAQPTWEPQGYTPTWQRHLTG